MKSDFLLAITQLSAEKNLPREVVLEAVEAALASAYHKEDFVPNQNISVKINPANGKVEVWAEKKVDKKITDSRTEISLADARKLKPDAEIGEMIMVEATPSNAGRIAAQTAKQVILQRLHEAEHSAIFQEYAGKEHDIVSGLVQRIELKQIYVNLGRTEAILPASEQVPTERYRVGQRLKVYILEVSRTNKGPRVVVSRSHANLLRRLFELEVPEVYNGIVEIKAVAREAGYRSKVAVAARQEGIDPVGCCVGLRGIRIQNIVNELNGEKIDVIMWDPDDNVLIANALSPAQVLSVKLDGDIATVVVPDRQLSLAIGKDGQNARLAAKLSGWRIDIKSASMAEAERTAAATAEVEEEAAPEPAAEVITAELEEEPEAAKAAPEPAAKVIIAELEEEPEEAKAPEPAAEVTTAELEEEPEEEELSPEPAVEVTTAELEEEPEEAEAVTVLDSSAIPHRISFKPQESQIRFAEDIFIDRRSKSEPRARRKKKKGAIMSRAKTGDEARLRRVRPERGTTEDEGA